MPEEFYIPREDDIVTVITVLEHVNRVCEVRLCVTHSELEMFSTAMRKPFPVKIDLQ